MHKKGKKSFALATVLIIFFAEEKKKNTECNKKLENAKQTPIKDSPGSNPPQTPPQQHQHLVKQIKPKHLPASHI